MVCIREQQTSVKIKTVNILGFEGHMSLLQLLDSATKVQEQLYSRHKLMVWLYSNKTLFLKQAVG